MKQVILNLVQNAIKFTTQGGIKLIVDFNKLDRELWITVQDSGIGISEID